MPIAVMLILERGCRSHGRPATLIAQAVWWWLPPRPPVEGSVRGSRCARPTTVGKPLGSAGSLDRIELQW